MNFAVSLNVATIDLNLASGNRIDKVDFPGAAGLADNLGSKLTIANFKNINLQELSPALGNGAPITDVRQLVQQFTARGETRPAYPFAVAKFPNPPLSHFLRQAFFLRWGCCAGNG